MKKWSLFLIGMLLAVSLFSSLGFAYNPVKQHARDSYKRTAEVLVKAQCAAEQGHNYQGLGKAIAQQGLARDYYYIRNFEYSIYHTLYARRIALRVIQRNDPKLLKTEMYDQTEISYINKLPKDEELDLKLKVIEKDESAVKVRINLEL